MDNKDSSELFLYNIGVNLLGMERAKLLEPKVVMAAGLIGCMGTEFARAKGIKCDKVDINFPDKCISFIKDDIIIDKLYINNEDISNPSKWLDNLYKQFNVK